MSASGPLPTTVEEREALAERVSAAVLALPGVAGPHGGLFNDIATFRPGGRLIGVRVGEGAEPVEVGVVLRLDRPIPEVVAELRHVVAGLCTGAAVDVTVGDVTVGDVALGDPAGDPPADPVGDDLVGGAAAGAAPGRMVR